jgi:hypothetical protein
VLRQAGHQGQHQPQDVRDLGGRVDRVLVALGQRLHHHAARLHRGRDQPLLQVPPLDHDVGLGLGRVVVAAVEGPQERLVGALVGVHQDLVLERLLHVHDRGQRVVVDLDRLQRVRGRVAVAGHHHGDALADVPDLVDRERVVVGVHHVRGHRPRAGQRAELVGEVGAGEGGHHPGPLQRSGHVDPGDPGVRDRAAHDRHVQQARHRDVVGPPGPAGDQPAVLLAAQRLADVLARVGGVELLGVLPDLLGDQAGVDLLGHAVTSAADASVPADLDMESEDMDWEADRTARTMFW